MKPGILLVALSLALLGYHAVSSAAPLPVLPAALVSEPAQPGEVARIQAHLVEVEGELLGRDVSHLTTEQRMARAKHIRVLREYRESGRFPHNHDFPGERVPYFVDEHGTLCAMAYLIARSGRGDLVERVAATRNNASIPKLAGDAQLVAWLEEAGLSLEEAARIQPMYNGGGCCWIGDPPAQPDAVSPDYALASTLASGLGGLSIGLNARSLRSPDGARWPGVLGVAAGAAGIALGLEREGNGTAASALAAANLGIGTLAAGLGTWNLVRPGEPTPDAPVPASRQAATLSVSPLIAPNRNGEMGMLLRVEF